MKWPHPTSFSVLEDAARATGRTLGRAFPTPTLIAPPSAGVDISDSSIKWLAFSSESGSLRVGTYGEVQLQAGVVDNGIVKDADALAAALGELAGRMGGIRHAHAALPEEAAYVFEMYVPEGSTREQVLEMIEFEFEGRVPISPEAAVYDYDATGGRSPDGEEIAVIVFPNEVAENYASAFAKGGLTLSSLELEARSIARAVSSRESDEPITLLVDFGRERTGFAVLKRGIPIFTSTVEMGGETIGRALMDVGIASLGEAEEFRNESGLLVEGKEHAERTEAVMRTTAALADEVARHYHYWDTRRNDRGERMTPVGQIAFVGGSANLKGLCDFIAGRVHSPVSLGNVWRHACDFDRYIPPIDKRVSLQYATAVGLALRPFLP